MYFGVTRKALLFCALLKKTIMPELPEKAICGDFIKHHNSLSAKLSAGFPIDRSQPINFSNRLFEFDYPDLFLPSEFRSSLSAQKCKGHLFVPIVKINFVRKTHLTIFLQDGSYKALTYL